MAMKQLLLISPDNHSIYSDIVSELQRNDIIVDFLPDRMLNYDPDNVRAPFHMPRFLFSYLSRRYWSKLLSTDKYCKKYDYLLVIDGLGVSSVIFEILKRRNPNIFSVNYLYDTISGVYRFDRLFPFYDKVYSFDKEECEEYGLNFLPIFWVPLQKVDNKYFFFAFGGYSEDRYEVFKEANSYSQRQGKVSFIGLFLRKIKNERLYAIKRVIRRLFGKEVYLSLERYHDPLLTNVALSPDDFRNYISSSTIIVDTHPSHQSGLTARFMWALGARKKIVTTNKSITQYPFYTKEQIYVLSDLNRFNESFYSFANSQLELSDSIEKAIDSYRIDNWVKAILSL